jgi:hypothetical protein
MKFELVTATPTPPLINAQFMSYGDLGYLHSINSHKAEDREGRTVVLKHSAGLISLSHPERSWSREDMSTNAIVVELLTPGDRITLEAE